MLDDPLVMYRMEALPLLPPVPDPMLGQMRIVRFLSPVQFAVNVAVASTAAPDVRLVDPKLRFVMEKLHDCALAAVHARPEKSAKTKSDFIDMSMDR
jgi:hypothetical protein